MRRAVLALAAILAVLAPGTPAWAHAQLVAADPAGDAALAEAPATVTLTFSERLDPDYTTILVRDAATRRVPASAPVTDDATGAVTLTGPVGNGLHTVAYRVVSVDGHTVQGSYTFTVADPALPPAAGASTATATPPAGSGGIPTGVLIVVAALSAVAVAIAIVLHVSGRRRAAAGA